MLRKMVLLVAILATFLMTASPALALQYGAPTTYYVDTAYTGTEAGTPSQPYSTLDKAVAAAQGQPYGAYIYTKNTAGGWTYYGYIAPVGAPGTGMAISGPALFALLAIASLVLILGGWFLLRRSRTLARQV